MASFFQKVVAKECKGEVNQQCPRFVNKQRLQAYKTTCECGSKTKEITDPDWLKIGAVLAVGLLVSGGGGWYVWSRVASAAMSLPGTSSPGDPSRTRGEVSPISWRLVAESGGSSAELNARDFDAGGGTYTARKSFSQGDRLRLEVSYKTDKLYAFHRSGTEATLLRQDSGGRTTLPAPDSWFQLDEHPGTEEFILVAGNRNLPDLDTLKANIDPAALDQAIRNVNQKDVTVIRIRVPHR